MSAADCPGCGLPVATPADAGSWTPDGTVCWRGGRCEVPVTADADADYEHALGGLRGHIVYGEQTAGDTPIAWVQVKVALPYLRDAERALVAERTRAVAAEADRDHWRARAEAAEAEVARLRAGSDVLIAERDDARLMSRCNHDNWRSALSDVDALRATTEGRAAPTEAEVRAHAATGGRWRARLSHGGIYTARYPDAAILDHDGALWWAIDRDDNNCPWPTPALDAAGEGR